MIVTFYSELNDDRVVNKTLVNGTDLELTLRADIDIYNPILYVSQANYDTSFNYFYIPDFGKYYFITNYDYTFKGVYRINSHIDVLTTYKEEILNANVLISQGTVKEPYFDGGQYNSLEKVVADVYNSDTDINYSWGYVLVTVGSSLEY